MSDKILKGSAIVITDGAKYIIPIKSYKRAIPDEIPEQETANEFTAADEKINFDILEKEREAELILHSAEQRAAEIIHQAEQTAKQIVDHTLERVREEIGNSMSLGYERGYADGKAESASVIEPALSKIGKVMNSIKSTQDKMLEDYRDCMIDMIRNITKKIVHKEIAADDSYLIGLFKEAIKDMKIEEYVTLTVSSHEIEFATKNKQRFLDEIEGIKDFKIISDENAPYGTCIVESIREVADASVGVQLDNSDDILAELKEALALPLETSVIPQLSSV